MTFALGGIPHAGSWHLPIFFFFLIIRCSSVKSFWMFCQRILAIKGRMIIRRKIRAPTALQVNKKFLGMMRVFQLMDSSEGYLAHLYRFVQPHVIVYSLPT